MAPIAPVHCTDKGTCVRIPELLKVIDSLPRVMHLELDGKLYRKAYQHTFSPSADARSIASELLGNLWVPPAMLEEQCQPFYQFANGMRLFHSETEEDDSGTCFILSIAFYPLDRLAADTAYMQSQVFHEMHLLGDAPPIYSEGLVVGEAAGTGNPFVLVRWGAHAGKLVYADHDPDMNDWLNNPFASSLADFLQQIALPPYGGLCKLCGADTIWFE